MSHKPIIEKDLSGLRLAKQIRKGPLEFFARLANKRDGCTWLSIMGKPTLFITDAKGVEYVLQDRRHTFVKSKFYDALEPILGNGLFRSEGEAWRSLRRETAPVFAGGYFQDYVEHMVQATDAMFKRLEPRIKQKQAIDLNAEMMWLTIDVVFRALFHTSNDDAAIHMKDALGTMLGEAERRIWAAISLPQKLVLRMPKYKNALGFINSTVGELVSARKKDKKYPDDLLSRLINARGESEAEQSILRDQVVSILLGGHETTSISLTWAFYELGRNHHIKEKLLKEVDDVLQGNNPTFDSVKNLTLTNMVFEESLRLYPPVWTFSRRSTVDDDIPLDNGSSVSIPSGTNIMLCAYGVHRRAKYWEEPEAFWPERFEREKKALRPAASWFPFAGGHRVCLGQKFASVEAVIILAMIYQKYNLVLISGQKIEPLPTITLRPNGPVLFNFVERAAGEAEINTFTEIAAVETVPSANTTSPQGAPKGCPFHAAKAS